MKRLIGMFFPTNACNLNCSYCYINKDINQLKEINRSLEDIERAFSPARLGGICFINISSNGEPLMAEKMIDIIKCLAGMGHYLMVLTNGTLSHRFSEIVKMDNELQKRVFFKFSFHYLELKRKNLLDVFFENVNKVKLSNFSFTIELMGDDYVLKNSNEIQKLCIEKIDAKPHISIPRDERQYTLGVLSKYSFERYVNQWKNQDYDSSFFEFKAKTYGKHVDWFCYAGMRSIWVNVETGMMHQCYHTPIIQDFFDMKKDLKWLPVGNNCCEAHCYVSHMFMPLGIVDTPDGVKRESYFNMRNRCGGDGIDWVKPSMREVFENGVECKELSDEEKLFVNEENRKLHWSKPDRKQIINNILLCWLKQKILSKDISEYFKLNGYLSIAIYGFGELGRLLFMELKESGVNIAYIIDRDANKLKNEFLDINFVLPEDDYSKVDAIIITPILDFFRVKEKCKEKCEYSLLAIEEVVFGNGLHE